MIVDNRVFWSLPKFKESMDFHWCEIGKIVNSETKLEHRFNMFCRKSDCRCFVEDKFTDTLIEFNGAKASAIKICKLIINNETVPNDKTLE